MPPREDELALRRARANETLIEIVDEIRRAPVKMRLDRRAISRENARDHEAGKARRQEDEHRGIGDVVADQPRRDGRKAQLDVVQRRIDDRRSKRDDDPRPRPQRVVHHLKSKGAKERVGLGARREHALRDVAAAARLRAGIPYRPPQDRDRNDENAERRVPIVKVRQNRERTGAAVVEMRDQSVQTADAGRVDGEVGGRERRAHRDAELNHVGHHHAPETRGRGKDDRD